MMASGPREILRGDLLALGFSLAAGLAAATATALTAALGADLATAQAMAPYGLVVGLAYGLMYWSTLGFGAGRRYLVFLLCMRGRLPLRLGRFLDRAYHAGLLRVSGIAYQFRHRELQHWLTDNPAPAPGDPRRSTL